MSASVVNRHSPRSTPETCRVSSGATHPQIRATLQALASHSLLGIVFAIFGFLDFVEGVELEGEVAFEGA